MLKEEGRQHRCWPANGRLFKVHQIERDEERFIASAEKEQRRLEPSTSDVSLPASCNTCGLLGRCSNTTESC